MPGLTHETLAPRKACHDRPKSNATRLDVRYGVIPVDDCDGAPLTQRRKLG